MSLEAAPLPGAAPLDAGRASWRQAATTASRSCVLLLLVAAPLALGAVHEWARMPFWFLCFTAGAASWVGSRLARADGELVPPVPGSRLLYALHALVAFQLLPLPVSLLGLLSPGSLKFYRSWPGHEHRLWMPVSVSPSATLRGLVFLAAVSFVYAAVFRDFRQRQWSRRLAAVVVGVAVLMTAVGLMQMASPDPGRIYGLWKPPYHSAVFGPYVNRTHYAGHVVMAVPLALGFAVAGLRRTRETWLRRSRGFIALGEPEASAALLGASFSVFIVVGILNCGSRTGVGVLALMAIALPLAFGRRWRLSAVLLVVVVAVLGYGWADLDWLPEAFRARGIHASRIALWSDLWRIVPDFPLLGVGLNALGLVYRGYQTIYRWNWWGEAHNEYYQALLDMGLLGAGITAALLWVLFGRAIRGARESAFRASLFGALLAQAAANAVDFNWQIPANAATFAALAGLAMGAREAPASGAEQGTSTSAT